MTTATTIKNSGTRRIPPALNAAASTARRLHPLVWLYLIGVLLPIGFDLGTLSLSLLRTLLLLTTVPLFFGLIAGRFGKVYPVDWLFFLHMCWATVAIAVNNPNKVVENIGSTAIEFLGGYLIARAFIRSREDFIALVRVLGVMVCLTVPLAVSESVTDVSVIAQLISSVGLQPPYQVDMAPRMDLFRAQTVFAHPIHYGLFCSAAFSLVFVGMKGTMNGVMRYLIAFAVLCGVFLSLSSGALLAVFLQISLIAWAFGFRNLPRRWTLLLALFGTMYVVIDLLSNRTPIRVLMTYATFSTHNAYYRAVIYEWGMINVWANPIFGLGLRPWVRPGWMHTTSVDNFWLVSAMRYGIPGFLLLALGYLDALVRVGRKKLVDGSPESQLRLAWMITFCGLSFTLITVHIWTTVYSFVFFLLGSGLWIASASSEGTVETKAQAPAGPAYARARQTVLTRAPLEPSETTDHARPANVFATAARPSPVPDQEPKAEREATPYTRFPGGPKKRRTDP
ncbi:MAG: O-antigen ligase family protein [Paracoccaceae bacterium]|nr:O-antigen ligase family protein [Paracoccaceae bacterium]